MKHLTASLIFCIVFLCAVTIHAARLAPWTPGEMHGTDVAWVPGIGDAAKGIGRGSLNAAEEIGEAAAKNLDNVGRAIPEIGRVQTDFIDGATVTSFGKTIGTGTVDVQSTIKGIESGAIVERATFLNKKGLLPIKEPGYYKEFVLPTPITPKVGPQRIIQGHNGELYYSPDHYQSFIPLN